MPEAERENLHVLLMGRVGAGKTTLLQTFPKPLLVWLFDPVGKDIPYFYKPSADGTKGEPRGTISKLQLGEYCYYRELHSSKDPGKLLIRVEYWSEDNPHQAKAYRRFLARTAGIKDEVKKLGWATVGLDTSTFFELAARMYDKYTEHPENARGEAVKDERVHYGASTRACEEFLMMRMPNLLLCNSVTLTHIDDQKDEDNEGMSAMKGMAALPGKLPNRLPGGYGEVWRVYYAGENDVGKPVYLIQTKARPNSKYECRTLMGFKDGVQAHYEALWEGR